MSSRGTKYWNSGSIPLIAPDLLGDIIAAASDLALVISDEGLILSTLVNPAHRLFGRLDHWEGQNIRDVLTRDSQPKVEARLRAFAEGGDTTGGVELNHSDRVAWDHPVRYSFHRIGPDGAVLMLGRDLRQIAEMQQQLVKAQVALERDYEAQREFDTRYRVLMDSTSEAFVFVSIGSGRIADVNAAAAALLGTSREELASASFAQEFEGRRRGEFTEALTAAALSDTPNPIELVTRRTNERVMVTPRVFRAAGERLILCRVSRESEEGERAVSAISEDLTALYEQGVDAIVFTDREGVIRSANESFLNLADAASAAVVRGRSLGEFFSRGSIDLKVLLENAARAGQMRLYATKLASEYGAEISVEISATYLRDRAHPAFVFVIRDASRVDAVRRPGAAVSDDAVRSVMELVGSATLKEIVAETTDVVEKMCIETAVELTRNNRVAAAEMLGLSRQSLYVKLRKYGLLSRDGD